LKTAGAKSLSVRLTAKPGMAVMDLQSVILQPIAQP
jgi:hypothetical protein